MKITFSPLSQRKSADVMLLPCFQEKGKAVLAAGDAKMKSAAKPALADFKAGVGECALVYGSHKEKRLMLVGLGPEKGCRAKQVRRAFGEAGRKILSLKLKSANIFVVFEEEAAVEGLALSSYAFDALKSKKTSVVLSSIGVIGAENEKGIRDRVRLAQAVHFSRDLVNGNADDVTPQYLASVAKELGKHSKVTTEVFDKKRIEKEKMGLLLAVNQGSHREPHLLIVSYKGAEKSKDHTIVVGKGVTYDTGGLNLKPTGSMEEMKVDMGGAAAALGVIKAATLLNLKVNVTAVVPTTENAIGPHSYKPGDVYTAYSGKTVEIFNTDAEGRLILADALAYACKNLKPTRIIDFATLTGAIVICLGQERSGLFSNNDALSKNLEDAGEKTGDKVWRLPTDSEYLELLKSDVADIKNCAKREAGSITAAKFLEEFVGKTPWAHVDIAGTCYLNGPRRYHSTKASGAGVRLLTQCLIDNAEN